MEVAALAGTVAIKDVAKAAGVSIKTVSRVLNGVPTVEAGLRQRVEAAIAELDYVPSPAARSLRTGTGSVVGVVVDSIDDPFFSALVGAVEELAIESGLDVVVASTRLDAERERTQLLRLVAGRPRGIILAPTGERHDYLDAVRASLPIVTVDRSLADFDSVTMDDAAGARIATEQLVRSGHRRIALIGYDPRFQTARHRRAGYEQVLAEHGLEVDPDLCPEVPFASTRARDAVESALALPDPPTALFLANARHATTVVAAVHALGRTDLALVSYGDFALADTVRPAVSCITQNPHEMGRLAVELLLSRAADPAHPPRHLRVPTTFVVRASHAVDAGTGASE